MHAAIVLAYAASRIVPSDVSLPIRPTYLSALQGGERPVVAVVRQAVGGGFSIRSRRVAHVFHVARASLSTPHN